jgi:ArsR family transcriptional regulator
VAEEWEEDSVSGEQIAPSLEIEEARRQVRVLKALADPTRVRILSLLGERGGELTVTQIVLCFKLEQATISGHLRVLLYADLIFFRKRKRQVYYFLNEEVLRQTIEMLEELLRPMTTIRQILGHLCRSCIFYLSKILFC